MASDTSDPTKLATVQEVLTRARSVLADSRIEAAWAKASDKQAACADKFHARKQNGLRRFAFVGGNRSGKSICGGWMCFAEHLRDHAADGGVYWFVAPTMDKSVSGQQKELWQALPRAMFGDANYDDKNGFGRPPTTIVLHRSPTCKVVVRFKASAQYDSDAATFEQEKVAGVWVDETIPEGLYDRLLGRVIDLDAPILITTIPDADWLSDRFEDVPESQGVLYCKFAMQDNAHNLPPGAIEKAAKEWSEEERQMRIFGNFRFLSGLVYKEFRKEYAPEGHLCKPFEIPASWPRWRGLDWGNKHPTAMLWLAISPNDTAFVYREYCQAERSVKTHAMAIQEMSKGERYNGLPICDPSMYKRDQANMRSIADEFALAGLRLRPARRASREHSEWAQIQVVKRWLERRSSLGPGLQVFDTCPSLIREFRHWKYKLDKEGKALESDTFEDRNNDCLDALKMLLCVNPSFQVHEVQVEDSLHGD